MRKMILSPFFICCIIIVIIIGYFIGYDISRDFYNLYIGKLTLVPTRYILLSLIIFASNMLYNSYSNPVIIVRKKTFFDFFIFIIKNEILFFLILFIFLHIPIFILNFNNFINNINNIIKIVINFVLVAILLSNLVKLIDIKIKNRIISSCGIIILFTLFDFILEHLSFSIFSEIYFEFSYIFILPTIYNGYIYIMIFILIIICITTWLIINESFRKDYFLKNENQEN